MDSKDLYIDEPCVVSFWFGEFGWFISRWQGYLRYLKQEHYKDRKFVLFANTQFHVLVQDFIYVTVGLPEWFGQLGLDSDCTEAPFADSPPGSLTPKEVYAKMIEFMRNFYSKEKSVEVFPPRGCNFEVTDMMPQSFAKFQFDKIESDKPIITVLPRGRARAAQRNVPEFVWREVVDKLKETFVVVLGGTPSGCYLADYEADGVINLIREEGDHKLDNLMRYLGNSVCSISSQGGLTHLSLACDCPSYIIGHEEYRHCIKENRLETPTTFRYVPDYRAIDANTILEDLNLFLNELKNKGYIGKPDYNEILNNDLKILNELMNKR